MEQAIRSYHSRYVVPFYFDYDNHHGYEKIRDFFYHSAVDHTGLALPKDAKWINAGFWNDYKSSSNKEMELYSYLPSIFTEADHGEKSIANLGISFVCNTTGRLFELVYQYDGKDFPFECKDLGVLLLKNGIGFLWYAIEFKSGKKNKCPISLDEYVHFQHRFKELARTNKEKNDRILKRTSYDKETNTQLDTPIDEPFCIGHWFAKLLSTETLGIRFWAEKETTIDEKKVRIPDKALLFQYLFIEKATAHEQNELAFKIANGYDSKYNPPDNIEEKTFHPFGNSCFYITKAGMACVVVNKETSAVFFDTQFRDRFTGDYFFIYMLLSYQSYSCAHYSRLLTKLPAEEKLFYTKAKYVDKLESLDGQINLFLVKSMFESVSNIHHQNSVYQYGKNELSIEKDIQSLTIGLEALKEMEREKKDRVVDRALIIFGFMVVISSWIDGLNLADWIMENGFCNNPLHILISIIILLMTLYLIITLIKNRRNEP